MAILFIFTMITCFLLFIGFLKNYQGIGEEIPHWFLIMGSVEILLYVVYFALRKYIRCSKNCGCTLLIIFHDVFLIALMLLVADWKNYFYISMTLLYYIFFFTVIVGKKSDWDRHGEIQRSSLPRKTFIEMTECINE